MDEQNDEGTTSKAAASNGVERRQRASDFRPEVLKLFDEYVHGAISRRTFLERAAAYAVTGIGAGALLEALSPNFAYAQVPADEPRIETEVVEFKSPKGNGRVRGYLARPKRRHGDLPVVLVAHENRGLNPHIEDITRRLALENFLAFAPDALSPLGGYPGNEDKARELFATLDQAKTREDFLAAAQFIGRHRDSNRRLGAVGFCWGGGSGAVERGGWRLESTTRSGRFLLGWRYRELPGDEAPRTHRSSALLRPRAGSRTSSPSEGDPAGPSCGRRRSSQRHVAAV